MTYARMKKQIEHIDKQIEFMKKIQSEKEIGDTNAIKNDVTCGDIINSLIGYKNYLIYYKKYNEQI